MEKSEKYQNLLVQESVLARGMIRALVVLLRKTWKLSNILANTEYPAQTA